MRSFFPHNKAARIGTAWAGNEGSFASWSLPRFRNQKVVVIVRRNALNWGRRYFRLCKLKLHSCCNESIWFKLMQEASNSGSPLKRQMHVAGSKQHSWLSFVFGISYAFQKKLGKWNRLNRSFRMDLSSRKRFVFCKTIFLWFAFLSSVTRIGLRAAGPSTTYDTESL